MYVIDCGVDHRVGTGARRCVDRRQLSRAWAGAYRPRTSDSQVSGIRTRQADRDGVSSAVVCVLPLAVGLALIVRQTTAETGGFTPSLTVNVN